MSELYTPTNKFIFIIVYYLKRLNLHYFSDLQRKKEGKKKGFEKISIEILGITQHWTPKVVISTTQYF